MATSGASLRFTRHRFNDQLRKRERISRGFAIAAGSWFELRDVAIERGYRGHEHRLPAEAARPNLRISIFEGAPALGYGSSGYSTGFLRAFYSFDETMQLALDGITAYKNWGEYTGLGDDVEAYFTETGALWMLGKTPGENRAMQDRLHAFGVDSDVLNAEDVAARSRPWPSPTRRWTSPLARSRSALGRAVRTLRARLRPHG